MSLSLRPGGWVGRDFCGSGRQKPGLEGQKTMAAEAIARPKEGAIVKSISRVLEFLAS